MRVDLVTLYVKAKKNAMRTHYSRYAEDFAAWLVIKYLEGKSQHQLIRHAFYDFLEHEVMPVKRLHDVLKVFPADLKSFTQEDKVILFDIIKKYATPFEIKMCELYLVSGLGMKEIGEIVGVSESRVSQRFKVLVQRINKDSLFRRGKSKKRKHGSGF